MLGSAIGDIELALAPAELLPQPELLRGDELLELELSLGGLQRQAVH